MKNAVNSKHRENLPEVLSAPFIVFKETKKGREKISHRFRVYGRFLVTSNASTMPTITIARIMPIIPGRMYWSANDAVCVACGVGVAAAGSTAKDLTACDGQ